VKPKVDVGRAKVEEEKEVNLTREVRARIGCPKKEGREEAKEASRAGDF
jgi:hypothetical protein